MQFTTITQGAKYSTNVTLRSGNERRILVKKEEVLNSSVRGGAYRTRWVAYNGGLYLKVTGDTRVEAVQKALDNLASRNMLPQTQEA